MPAGTVNELVRAFQARSTLSRTERERVEQLVQRGRRAGQRRHAAKRRGGHSSSNVNAARQRYPRQPPQLSSWSVKSRRMPTTGRQGAVMLQQASAQPNLQPQVSPSMTSAAYHQPRLANSSEGEDEMPDEEEVLPAGLGIFIGDSTDEESEPVLTPRGAYLAHDEITASAVWEGSLEATISGIRLPRGAVVDVTQALRRQMENLRLELDNPDACPMFDIDDAKLERTASVRLRAQARFHEGSVHAQNLWWRLLLSVAPVPCKGESEDELLADFAAAFVVADLEMEVVERECLVDDGGRTDVGETLRPDDYLPFEQELRKFLQESDEPMSKRELAKKLPCSECNDKFLSTLRVLAKDPEMAKKMKPLLKRTMSGEHSLASPKAAGVSPFRKSKAGDPEMANKMTGLPKQTLSGEALVASPKVGLELSWSEHRV